MVISSNPIPSKLEFQSLLENTVKTLDLEAKNNQEKYLKLLGQKLEDVVSEIMSNAAIGTPFENSIEQIGRASCRERV